MRLWTWQSKDCVESLKDKGIWYSTTGSRTRRVDADYIVEEKVRVKRPHRLNMEDRKRIDFTGITDVVSFDPVKVVLESDYGHITIKGEGLHVNRLSVEKGELDLDGRVDSVCYSEAGMKNKQDSFMSRLLR